MGVGSGSSLDLGFDYVKSISLLASHLPFYKYFGVGTKAGSSDPDFELLPSFVEETVPVFPKLFFHSLTVGLEVLIVICVIVMNVIQS